MLQRVDGVTCAAAVVHEGTICSFVVPGTLSSQTVRLRLRSFLPAHAIPAVVIPIDEMPLTVTGKLDRKQLPISLLQTSMHTEASNTALVSGAQAEAVVLHALQEDGLLVSASIPLMQAGLNSQRAVDLALRLRAASGLNLTSTLVFEHPTARAIAEHMVGLAKSQPPPVVASACYSSHATIQPIALRQGASRWPGSSHGLWPMLQAGGDAVREVPSERWQLDQFVEESILSHHQKMSASHGGFLPGAGACDGLIFGISNAELVVMDPQQRLLLEAGYESLHVCNQRRSTLLESSTGTFVAVERPDWAALMQQVSVASKANAFRLSVHSSTGCSTSIASGRLSFVLGLVGPCLGVDTACSSALVAAHFGCHSVRSSECVGALSSAASLKLLPHVALQNSHMLSGDGRCKTFDTRANGYARSEGVGALVLQLPSAADCSAGLLMASTVKQDGVSASLTAPNGTAQRALLQSSLSRAATTPLTIGCTEAHGTGTALGDPTEVGALTAVYGMEVRQVPLACTASKANVGHTEMAAGQVGMLLSMQAMQKQNTVANAQLRTVSSLIHEQLSTRLSPTVLGLQAPDRPSSSKLHGLSSFGYSGTIANALLQDGPELASPPSQSTFRIPWRRHVFCWRDDCRSMLSRAMRKWISTSVRDPLCALSLVALTLAPRLVQRTGPCLVRLMRDESARVGILELNDQKRMNGLSVALCIDIRDAVDSITQHGDFCAVVVQGAGHHFCTGGGPGLFSVSSSDGSRLQAALDKGVRTHLAVFGLRSLALPMVCAMQGHVIGGGLAIAGVADYSAADAHAFFWLRNVSLGMSVVGGLSQTLQSRIGRSRALGFYLSNESIGAYGAQQLGLVDEITHGGNCAVQCRALQVAHMLAQDTVQANILLLARVDVGPMYAAAEMGRAAACLASFPTDNPEESRARFAFGHSRAPSEYLQLIKVDLGPAAHSLPVAPPNVQTVDVMTFVRKSEAQPWLRDAMLIFRAAEGASDFYAGACALGAELSANAMASVLALLERLQTLRMPSIVVCHGVTCGEGIIVPCTCDLVLAHSDSSFAFPGTRHVSLASVISTVAHQRLDQHMLKWLLCSGCTIDAIEARRIGLVDLVGTWEQLEIELTRAVNAFSVPGRNDDDDSSGASKWQLFGGSLLHVLNPAVRTAPRPRRTGVGMLVEMDATSQV